jgi:hypothetical protein
MQTPAALNSKEKATAGICTLQKRENTPCLYSNRTTGPRSSSPQSALYNDTLISSAEVKERVDLYVYSPSCSPRPVLG